MSTPRKPLADGGAVPARAIPSPGAAGAPTYPAGSSPLASGALVNAFNGWARNPTGALADMVTGLARGAATTALGWPGDLEKLGALGLAHFGLGDAPSGTSDAAGTPGQATLLPTSEDVSRWLPAATQLGTPGAPNPYEAAGGWIPITPGQIARGVAGVAGAVKEASSALRSAEPLVATPLSGSVQSAPRYSRKAVLLSRL